MTYLAKPKLHHPQLPTNKLGYTRRDYEAAVSTLCAGCGHDSISAAIIQACFQLDLPPHRIAKLSGIGCSSKTPTYFLGNSHGFNSVHGRMPSVLTGANLANRDLIYLGVSGDGDSGSTKGFDYVCEHNDAVNYLDVITPRDEITVTYEAGAVEDVTQHDGTVLRLRKLAKDYDVHDPAAAMRHLLERQSAGEIVTGL